MYSPEILSTFSWAGASGVVYPFEVFPLEAFPEQDGKAILLFAKWTSQLRWKPLLVEDCGSIRTYMVNPQRMHYLKWLGCTHVHLLRGGTLTQRRKVRQDLLDRWDPPGNPRILSR